MTLRRLALLLPLLLVSPLAGASLALQAPDDIVKLLTPYVPEDSGSQRRLQDMLGEILATEGYFSPQFQFGERDGVTLLAIEPGPRTSIAAVDIVIDGPLDEARRPTLVRGWALPVGQPFRQETWNLAKQQVLARLLAEDHADARLTDSSADIDVATHRAVLRLHYAAGPRYRFGALQVDGLQRYDADLVGRYNRSVGAGRPYREEDLNALQAALQASPYFASVQVQFEREAAQAGDDGTLSAPVRVRVRERPPHRVAFGAGASSNTGARVEFSYGTPDLAGQAWELNSGLRLEQKRQTAYADVFLPPDERNRRNSFGAMGEVSDIQGLRTERYAFGVQSTQRRGSVEQRLSLNWQQERREPDGAEQVTNRALVPDVMWTWRAVDSLIAPRSGMVLQGQLGGGTKALFSDQNFIRLHGRLQYYLPVMARDTLMLRGEAGYTAAASRQRVPQDYLFRTGGAGSVRGYAYQSLGIKEGAATVGGRYLSLVSGEFTHWLDDVWGVAAFVDAGDAFDRLRDASMAVGYGLGARWRSPAGPIGADLAYGRRVRGMQLHFSLAIPF